MDYIDISEARSSQGLRLVLSKGVPGPWGEAAKACFELKGIPYTAVAQYGGQNNEELVGWLKHRNAPVAVYQDEPPRAMWLEIVLLAERLAPEPPLLPADIRLRMQTVGLCHEIASPDGFAWNARLLMLKAMAGAGIAEDNPMMREYGYSEVAAAGAVAKIEAFLALLVELIEAQRARGSAYLIGDSLTAADVFWACFSNILDPLPHALNPMPDYLRQAWGTVAATLDSKPDPCVIAQRDFTWHTHLKLPLEF